CQLLTRSNGRSVRRPARFLTSSRPSPLCFISVGTFSPAPPYFSTTARSSASAGIWRLSRMTNFRTSLKAFSLGIATAALLSPFLATAQTSSSASTDKWLHVRVVSTDSKGETVRVNIPLELAEKVLPAINKDRLHNGKVTINRSEMNDLNGVDC